jgi:hypothetical protein
MLNDFTDELPVLSHLILITKLSALLRYLCIAKQHANILHLRRSKEIRLTHTKMSFLQFHVPQNHHRLVNCDGKKKILEQVTGICRGEVPILFKFLLILHTKFFSSVS